MRQYLIMCVVVFGAFALGCTCAESTLSPRLCAEFIDRANGPLHSCVHIGYTDAACFQSPDEAALWVRDLDIALCYELRDAGR